MIISLLYREVACMRTVGMQLLGCMSLHAQYEHLPNPTAPKQPTNETIKARSPPNDKPALQRTSQPSLTARQPTSKTSQPQKNLSASTHGSRTVVVSIQHTAASPCSSQQLAAAMPKRARDQSKGAPRKGPKYGTAAYVKYTYVAPQLK